MFMKQEGWAILGFVVQIHDVKNFFAYCFPNQVFHLKGAKAEHKETFKIIDGEVEINFKLIWKDIYSNYIRREPGSMLFFMNVSTINWNQFFPFQQVSFQSKRLEQFQDQ